MAFILKEVGETFITLAKGFGVTFRNMLRKPVTENYPDEPVHFQARYRGIHVLHRDEQGLEKDRKSTRLNSSHLVISYAVFCLKKKKKKKKEPSTLTSE